jgi:hypothetical protein
LESEEAAYLKRIATELRPLSEEDYINGPAFVVHTLAKYSYVLDGPIVYWCIEWKTGLIVVRFSPNDDMAWAAIRSPVPGFGNREATEAEWDQYDEDARNPQYHLIFDPWDAQFDAQKREWKAFVPADAEICSRFELALVRPNQLSELIEQRFSRDLDAWVERCKSNLNSWCGDGIRLK